MKRLDGMFSPRLLSGSILLILLLAACWLRAVAGILPAILPSGPI